MDRIARQPLLLPGQVQAVAGSIQFWRRRFHEELFAFPPFICHAVPILIQEFNKQGIRHLFKILQISSHDTTEEKLKVVATARTNVERIATVFQPFRELWSNERESLDAPEDLVTTIKPTLAEIANHLLAISMRPEYILSFFSDCKRFVEEAQQLNKNLQQSSNTKEIGTLQRALQEHLGSSWATYESINDRWSAVCDAHRPYDTAKEILFSRNVRLADSWAKKYSGTGVDLEELKQEGYCGLMTAVERFDPERGVCFSTFAVPWIKNAISLYIQSSRHLVRQPSDILTERRQVVQFVDDFRMRCAREPGPEEIVEGLKERFPRVTVKWLQSNFFTHGSTVSLDNCGADGDSGRGLGEIIADKRYSSTDVAYNDEKNSEFMDAVDIELQKSLSDRDYRIFTMRYGLQGHTEMTLKEIGDQIGLDRERIRQIENKVLQILRRSPLKKFFDKH
jgi:RNA polymerase sigma factor (sigma-70 family)